MTRKHSTARRAGEYTVEFYPAWERGPGDRDTYHHAVAELDGAFKTLPAAKKAATSELVSHNRTHRDEKWRAEIYRSIKGGRRRSMYGRDIGYDYIKWERS